MYKLRDNKFGGYLLGKYYLYFFLLLKVSVPSFFVFFKHILHFYISKEYKNVIEKLNILIRMH